MGRKVCELKSCSWKCYCRGSSESLHGAAVSWQKRDPTIVSITCRVGSGVRVSELVPLFTVVGVGKKLVGLCHLPGSTEEDKALGPSCGHWGLAIQERCFACEEADQL